MSHSITITHTTRATATALYFNVEYLKNTPGLLKLAQLGLGIVAVTLVALPFQFIFFVQNTPQLLFLLMAVTFMIGTFCLLLSCLVSLSAASIISKTIYEIIYHSVAFVLYTMASMVMLVDVHKHEYPTKLHSHLFTSGIIGCVVSLLYLFSAVLAQRSYRGH